MLLSGDDAALLTALRAGFPGDLPQRLLVAVSGGGDSLALLHLLHRLLGPERLEAATVDHGLRPEAAAEAFMVARHSAALAIPHTTLHWRDHEPGNLQDTARRARFRLLADHALSRGIAHVALGHTADDQAETVLMRLARASGADGLAAMRPARTQHGVTFLRPMLAMTRADLRAFLTRHDIQWAEDPSNANDSFDRIKARRLLPALAPLGIDAQTLAEVAANMARTRDALDHTTAAAARAVATVEGGAIAIDPAGLADLPEEIARRLILHALCWLSGTTYAPRRAPLDHLLDAARTGQPATLAGVQLVSYRHRAWLCREPAAVAQLRARPDEPWDTRWRLAGGHLEGTHIAALGETGLRQCPDRQAITLPRPALLSSPALWRGETLLAAPLAGHPNGWQATGADMEAFQSAIITH